MAKLYPKSKELIVRMRQKENPDIENDKGFQGEMQIYEQLAKLPNGWVVIYSYWLKDISLNLNCEADFVVLVPDKGILVLEVKTRILRLLDGLWVDSKNNPLQHSPSEQAFLASKNIIRFLEDRSIVRGSIKDVGNPAPFVSYAHLAVLNNIQSPEVQFADKESYVFNDDIPNLRQRIEAAFQYDNPFPDYLQRAIKQALLETVRFKMSPAYMSQLIETKAAQISKLLPMLQESPNGIWVEGCAGSGKTVIAVNEIIRLSKAEPKAKILYTCYNRALAARISDEIDERLGRGHKVTVCTFFGLLQSILTQFKVPNGCIDDDDCDAIIERIDRDVSLRFDYAFVDEAQDHGADEQRWSILSHLCARMGVAPYEHIYAFADSNQKLYNGLGNRSENFEPLFGTRVRLSSNLRNPGRIGRCGALAFDKGMPLAYLPLPGQVTLTQGANTAEGRVEIITGIINEIVEIYGEDAYENIVILSPLAAQRRNNALDAQRSLLEVNNQWYASDNLVRMSTIKAFKGLEAPFVILTDIPGKSAKLEWGYQPDDFYVGCTRAKERLYIVPTVAGENELRPFIDALKEEDDDFPLS